MSMRSVCLCLCQVLIIYTVGRTCRPNNQGVHGFGGIKRVDKFDFTMKPITEFTIRPIRPLSVTPPSPFTLTSKTITPKQTHLGITHPNLKLTDRPFKIAVKPFKMGHKPHVIQSLSLIMDEEPEVTTGCYKPPMATRDNQFEYED